MIATHSHIARHDPAARLAMECVDLFRNGNQVAAVTRLEGAMRQHPENLLLARWLGRLYYCMGNTDRSSAMYMKILHANPDDGDALAASAQLALDCGNVSRAAELYRKVLSVAPNFPGARHNLGLALESLWSLDEAEALLREQNECDPSNAETINALANVLRKQGRYNEALASYRAALTIAPSSHEILSNLGLAYYEQGDFPAAINAYRQALALDANRPLTHLNLAFALLAAENFEEGWKEFEWRLRVSPLPLPISPDKQLHDLKSLQRGQSVLVCAEQGFGDTLQFVRYLPALRESGAEIHLACQPALRELLSESRCCTHVVAYDEVLPEHDYVIPLLSVPRLLGVDRHATTGATPYLFPGEQQVQLWRDRLPGKDGRLYVGIAWAGSRTGSLDRIRSVPDERIHDLLAVPGICFVNLQKDRDVREMSASSEEGGWFDAAPLLRTFHDTAALMASLDLVISADTAVAHLAGALNVRVWTMVPYAADWRWVGNGETTDWYPRMRLFRQSRLWDWEGVVKRVASALRQASVE